MNQKSLHTLEYDKIIEKLISFCASKQAKETASKLLPFTDMNAVCEALTNTNDALSRIYAKGNPSFFEIRDIRPSLKRLEAGASLSSIELLHISSLLSCARNVKNFYEDCNDSLTEYFNVLEPLASLHAEIQKCILSEEEISDDASPRLKEIRRQIRLANDRIHTELNKILNAPATRTYLQDYIITMRSGRYCLPVKAEYKSQVSGMIHDQSATGSTLFIEPAAVVKLNNDIRELALKEQAEIEAILAALSAKAAEHTVELATDYTALTELDFIFAKGHLSRHFRCSRPLINDKKHIHIKQGRHPLIPADTVVPIDIELGDRFRLLVITGPNTGGKTVSLKTVGLLTLMAQAGLNIPALENSEIAIFNDIFADIGDEQSIEQSLSTFSSHMTRIVHILQNADENSLVLFDEIGAGTDPTEGAALAVSILNDLLGRGVTTMSTTHYSEIKLYALTTEGVENACCEFDVASLKPTYRLLIGVPGKSNAFAISKKLGLPQSIIDDAASRISADTIHFEDLLSDLESSRITIQQEQEELNRYKEEVRQLKADLKAKSKNLDERTNAIIRKANEQAAEILRDAKEFADETIKVMNKHGVSVKDLEKQRSAVRSKLNSREQTLVVKKPIAVKKAQDIKAFQEGMYVRIAGMNLVGTVSSIHASKNEITVLVGSMRTKVKQNQLEILENYAQPEEQHASAKKGSGAGKIKMSKSASISPEINLLGLTVDEAVARLDKYLDDAYLAKIPQVRIVHGKGTGALRNGVTAYLRGIPYVQSFRLGEIGEGDAGVTIVDFK